MKTIGSFLKRSTSCTVGSITLSFGGGGDTDVCPSGEAKLHPLRLQGENLYVGGLIGFGVPRIVMRE